LQKGKNLPILREVFCTCSFFFLLQIKNLTNPVKPANHFLVGLLFNPVKAFMKKSAIIYLVFPLIFIFSYCSKKTNPGQQTSTSVYGSETSPKPVIKKAVKTPVPKVIVVNDVAAKKTFDGRLYYDLEGRRYWKNYKDGKYYLFNKSMTTNPDFKKP